MEKLETLFLAGLLSAASLSAPALGESQRLGVLVLAHGGGPEWNTQVRRAVEEADLSVPIETAFGMGMDPAEVAELQKAVDRLAGQGVRRIRVIPLLVSSYSSVYRQYEYLFRLRPDPSWREHPVKQVVFPGTVQITGALDDSPWVSQILLERAWELSRKPAQEAVVLVAHGPEGEEDTQAWLAALNAMGARVKGQAGFAEVAAATLRDDAPAPVRAEAVRQLREKVETLSRRYRVLVVPVLISHNGIEQKIAQALDGLAFAFSGRALLPHENISRWIRESAKVE